MIEQSSSSSLVVISGPSGSGKTTLVERLDDDPRVDLAVTATTRRPREGEQDGVDYHFLSREEFERRIAAGDFVEYNEVFRNGHFYGSLRASLEEGLANKDKLYVLEIDVEGGLKLKQLGYAGRYVFIAPPSEEELVRRLKGRGTESAAALEQRLKKVQTEMELKDQYDRTITNDDLARALRELRVYLGLEVAGEQAR